MTNLIKKTLLATPIAAIISLGFASVAFASQITPHSDLNDTPLNAQTHTATAVKTVKSRYSDYSYAPDYSYKTVNYSHGYNYKPRKPYYKNKRGYKKHKPYYKAKPSYYGKGYKHGYKPVYKSKHKPFKYGKAFRKNHKRKFRYKY